MCSHLICILSSCWGWSLSLVASKPLPNCSAHCTQRRREWRARARAPAPRARARARPPDLCSTSHPPITASHPTARTRDEMPRALPRIRWWWNRTMLYVIPPNADLTLEQGVIQNLLPRTQQGGQHLTIDRFSRSLAQDHTLLKSSGCSSGNRFRRHWRPGGY